MHSLIWAQSRLYWAVTAKTQASGKIAAFSSFLGRPMSTGPANTSEVVKSPEGLESNCLSTRVEKLGRSQNIVLAFQSWMGEGRPVQRGDIFHTINRLRKLHKYHRALQVAEWVLRERPYKLKEIDYSYVLEFTGRVHDISRAEKLFMHVPSEFQNELLHNNLVMGCLEKRLVGKTLQYMKKMRELSLPIAPMIYNRLILLYESLARKKHIPSILTQMKADGVVPNTCTYNILLNIKAKDHDIEGMQKVFDGMKQSDVQPNEITYCILANAYARARLYTVAESYVEAAEKARTDTNWSTLDMLVSLYGSLGKEKDLERVWKLVEKLPDIRSKSYVQGKKNLLTKCITKNKLAHSCILS